MDKSRLHKIFSEAFLQSEWIEAYPYITTLDTPTIEFNDLSLSESTINNYDWVFGDGEALFGVHITMKYGGMAIPKRVIMFRQVPMFTRLLVLIIKGKLLVLREQ